MKIWSYSSLWLWLSILFSSSLSAQWVRQYPLAKMEDVLDIVVQPDGFGFACGPDDMVLRLNPAMQEWELAGDPNLGWSLEAVDYLNNTLGAYVAVGGQGLLVSTDAGNIWQEIQGAPAGIHVIKILPNNHILVIADEGVFLWNNVDWTDLQAPVTSGIWDGHILDDMHIWCFSNGADPVIYYTHNGGTDWQQNTDIDRPDVVKFFNSTFGVATDSRRVFHSLDGGMNWTQINNNVLQNSANDFSFGTSPNIIMAGTNNSVTITQDTGRTWTELDMGLINSHTFSVASFSDTEWWTGNDLSSIAYTNDSGTTWSERSGPDRNLLFDAHFIDRNLGFAVGSMGTLLRTTNGGLQWEELGFDNTKTYLAVHGLQANDVWIAQNRGVIHSTDMGDNWEVKLNLSASNINDVLAVTSNLVLACSTSGTIYRSDDGGMSWDTVFQTNGQIRSVAKIDDQRFMATGFNGLIVRSEDQGLTWNSVTVPEAGLQYEQSYFLGQDGWLVTSSFKKTMWHTSNAGDSWDPITLPVDRNWDGVFFMSQDTGIVVCRTNAEGRAYITFNGGQNWQSGHIVGFPLYGVTGIPNPNGTAWIHGYGSDIETLPYCTMLPVISDFNGSTFPCENDTVTYSITSQDVDEFFWLFPTGWQIIGNANNDTVLVEVGRNAGTISVTGINSCGFSSPINVGAGPILLPTFTELTGDQMPCEAELITYTASSADVNDFVWTFPGTDWQIFGQSNKEEVQVFVGETPGTIVVTGTNSCGESIITLDVEPLLRPRMHGLSGETNPCQGTVYEYVGDEEFATEVIWTFPSDWEAVGAANEAVIQLRAGESSGMITSTAENVCGMSATAELPVTPTLVPEVAILADGAQLYPTSTGVAYQWYVDGTPIPGATSDSLTPVVSGSYTVLVTFDNGCSRLSLPVLVMISGIFHPSTVMSLEIYPMPVRDVLHVKGIENEFSYSILDFTGKVVVENIAENNQVSVRMLAEGIYVLKVVQDGITYLGRFVKSKE